MPEPCMIARGRDQTHPKGCMCNYLAISQLEAWLDTSCRCKLIDLHCSRTEHIIHNVNEFFKINLHVICNRFILLH